MNKTVRKILSYAGAVLLMLVLSYAYVPQVLQGKIVNQSDISGYQGMAHEMSEYNADHPGEPTHWTGSMFCGMPTTSFESTTRGDATDWIYKLFLTGKRPASYLFISLLGAFLMLLSLGVNGILALGGAVAVTFCSYNFQIIQVGHNSKMQALAFVPYVLAAIFFTYGAMKEEGRRRYLLRSVLGASLFAIALDMQIKANHQQISYYLAIVIAVYVVALFISVIRKNRGSIGRFFATSALLLTLGLVGIGTNANKLLPLLEYTPHTMRGGSELASAQEEADGSKGLELDYATAWSYGWEELPNLLIPNFNGGSSAGAVDPDKSQTYALLKRAGQPNLREVCRNLPLYWGPQPFTAGPMYLGAITIFLFLFGLFALEGRDKWWVLVASLIAILLSLGHHFLWFTQLFYDYAPMYNKFRTVSMSLTVLQVTVPLLGFLALSRAIGGNVATPALRRALRWSFCISGGLCLLCALVPSIAGSFTGSVDAGQNEMLVKALQADRMQLLRSDAFRSLFFICVSAALIWWGTLRPRANADSPRVAAALICLLVLVDLWGVGRRYLSADDFVTPKAFIGQFDQRPVDKLILQDPEPSYRVLDLTTNVFNDSHPSYWHKSIGGYSPAKLQRYQDLIDRYISSEIRSLSRGADSLPVLSMLNTKYFIYKGDAAPIANPDAFGNAWFVSSARYCGTVQEEISALGEVDLGSCAVIGPDFAWAADAVNATTPRESSVREDSDVAEDWEGIVLTSYAPNELKYHYCASGDRAVVFSEIYYPDGWKLKTADGAQIPMFRADWTLRGAVLPAGEGDIVMSFEPSSYARGCAASRACSWLLLALLVLSAGAVAVDMKKDGSKS